MEKLSDDWQRTIEDVIDYEKRHELDLAAVLLLASLSTAEAAVDLPEEAESRSDSTYYYPH